MCHKGSTRCYKERDIRGFRIKPEDTAAALRERTHEVRDAFAHACVWRASPTSLFACKKEEGLETSRRVMDNTCSREQRAANWVIDEDFLELLENGKLQDSKDLVLNLSRSLKLIAIAIKY